MVLKRKTTFSALAMGLLLTTVSALTLQPALGQQRSITWTQTTPALDPHLVMDAPNTFNLLNIYDGLYRYQGNPPELVPWLAESYSVSEDGLVWEFTLKDGVVFHDGRPLTAADVVYSFQRVLGLNRGPATIFSPVLASEAVEEVDALTVRFTLSEPYAPFLTAIPTVAIVNAELLQENEVDGDWGSAWLAANDAGSGAYQLVPGSFTPQVQYDLAIFEDHFYGWDDNPAAPTLIHALAVNEIGTAVMGVLSGSLDATTNYLNPDDVTRIESGGGIVSRDEAMRTAMIHINTTKPPLDNVNFRKCISYAVNYDAIITEFLFGAATRTPTPLPGNLWGVPDDPPGYTYDLALAQEHCDLARAEGAPVDRGVVFQDLVGLEATSIVAQLLQSELEQIGIPMTIETNTWANVISSTASAETSPDLWMSWISGYYVDPDNWIGQMYDSAYHGTWKASSFYANDELDAILREARVTLDQAERQALYEQAVQIVYEDAPEVWLWNSVDLRGLTPKVATGFNYSPVSQGSELRWIQVQ